MPDTARCSAGDWVEIEAVLLEPSERASGLPPETAEKPLLMWVKGFALYAAATGEDLEIETITGRRVAGRLSAIDPGYTHTFGQPTPELAPVGRDLRARLEEYRATECPAATDESTTRAESGEPAEGGDAWW